MSSELAGYYARKPVSLWVEDLETRDYIREVWNDPDITYLIAGGSDSVIGVVRDAAKHDLKHVLGVVDRDLRPRTNRPQWLDRHSDVSVFVLDALELECLAIDEEVIASLGTALNPKARTVADLRTRAEGRAKGTCWWMALRAYVSEVRRSDVFPSHPRMLGDGKPSVSDLASSMAWLTARFGPWLVETGHKCQQLRSLTDASARLQALHDHYAACVHDGTWRRAFSGKEVFDDLAAYVYRSHFPSGTNSDLLLAIARKQRELGRIPQELAELHHAIRYRAGMEPWPTSGAAEGCCE